MKERTDFDTFLTRTPFSMQEDIKCATVRSLRFLRLFWFSASKKYPLASIAYNCTDLHSCCRHCTDSHVLLTRVSQYTTKTHKREAAEGYFCKHAFNEDNYQKRLIICNVLNLKIERVLRWSR